MNDTYCLIMLQQLLKAVKRFLRLKKVVLCLLLSVTLSLTHSLTNSCFVNLIDATLACEDANTKLFEVVTVADVDAEATVG